MSKENLLNTEIYKLVKYRITVTEIFGNIPNELEADFFHWLQSKAVENGLGIHCEYYGVDDNYTNDVKILFKVTSDKI